jgi:hypothetical protein
MSINPCRGPVFRVTRNRKPATAGWDELGQALQRDEIAQFRPKSVKIDISHIFVQIRLRLRLAKYARRPG